jgi:L-asparaginase
MQAVAGSDVLLPEALPCARIYTVTRSGRPELTIHGIVYVSAWNRPLDPNTGRPLLRIGDTSFPLWSRSLLKPWQLMVIYPTVKEAYPALTRSHFAMMAASHSCDPPQIRLLEETLSIADLSEQSLRCPSCLTTQAGSSSVARALHHPCSGKHLGHLLYLRAKDLPIETYLAPETEPYPLLRLLLGSVLNRANFDMTTDSCGMPNLALSAEEMAQLYHALVMPVSKHILQQAPDELTDILACWDEVSSLVRQHPTLVGGERRLDTRLMRGGPQNCFACPIIAKEGADGLLCVGIGANNLFRDGLALSIKLASGYDPMQLERITLELLTQLGLWEPNGRKSAETVRTSFHFHLEPIAAGT